MIQQVDHYIDSLSEELQELAQRIRALLFELLPDIEERFSYHVPYYHYYGMFCYFNTLKGQEGLHLSFMRGLDLLELHPELEGKNRSVVASVSFYKKSDFNKHEIARLISSAALWQKEAHQSGKPFLAKKKKS